MKRRSLLINMSLAFGCSAITLDSKAIDSALSFNGTSPPQLNKQLLETLRTISDIIIPETDTPSASGAGVHLYIDYFLHDFYGQERRQKFIDNLNEIASPVTAFLSLSNDDRIALIQRLDDRLGSDQESAFYRELKDLIIVAYFSSEVGATQALKFDPIPGIYKEIKLDEVGRAWY